MRFTHKATVSANIRDAYESFTIDISSTVENFDAEHYSRVNVQFMIDAVIDALRKERISYDKIQLKWKEPVEGNMPADKPISHRAVTYDGHTLVVYEDGDILYQDTVKQFTVDFWGKFYEEQISRKEAA